MTTKPLEEHEIVVHVPKGSKEHVRVEEVTAPAGPGAPQITVRVSNKRKYDVSTPILGVIVK